MKREMERHRDRIGDRDREMGQKDNKCEREKRRWEKQEVNSEETGIEWRKGNRDTDRPKAPAGSMEN